MEKIALNFIMLFLSKWFADAFISPFNGSITNFKYTHFSSITDSHLLQSAIRIPPFFQFFLTIKEQGLPLGCLEGYHSPERARTIGAT